MVELAVSALSGLGSLFGLGGATAAGATATGGLSASIFGPAAATTAATSSTALTALQGFAATLTALGQIGSGQAQAQFSRDQAVEAKLQAGQEEVGTVQRQTAMKRELARVLGNNDVAFAAAGVDLAGGMATDAAIAAKERAASEISIDQRDADFRAALLKMRARSLYKRADYEEGSGLLAALGTGAGFGLSVAARG